MVITTTTPTTARSTATTAATAATATAARAPVFCLVDPQRATTEFELVSRRQHLLGVFVVEFHEGESFRAPRLSIHDHTCRMDLTELREEVL